ncbi:MAG TPA: DUF4230 domain-containing protein [Verrucomicrobiae bacterium]|jgi:hypothetical protein|nr:DUF4230 domain-containing protein [Verrucomicrobiae bacterium]
MFKRIAAVGAALLLILSLGLLFAFVSRHWLPLNGVTTLNTPAILTRVQTLSQLVTVKYVLEKVVVVEDAKWYGENRVVLVAHGIAKAGIDFSRLKPDDLKVSDKKISIALPKALVTDVYLDEARTEVLDRTTGIMRVFDKDLEQNARRQAVDDLRRAALQEGIIKDASDRARAQLSNLFFQMGFSEVEFQGK